MTKLRDAYPTTNLKPPELLCNTPPIWSFTALSIRLS